MKQNIKDLIANPSKNAATQSARELYLQILCARADLESFIRLKHKFYSNLPYNQNWHTEYISKVLECTLPHFAQKHKESLKKRVILNMPPSYGKTEIICRNFISWALGHDRSRKFIYISYSDDLAADAVLQTKLLMKSPLWSAIFGEPPHFIKEKATEIKLKEGGGLFATTLKGAITGFHGHSILIDDPIKASLISSRKERENVNKNFKESVLSRLKDNDSSIIILMQRLGDDDLCGFLQNPREFSEDIIKEWQILKLVALNTEPIEYKIGEFSYKRAANEPLFPARHNLEALNLQKLQMGADEFSTQYQQEPVASFSGFFEPSNFTKIAEFEIGAANTYIFVDNATSTESRADNRAAVAISAENLSDGVRYIVRDCICGIWEEDQTAEQVLDLMAKFPKAPVFIEKDGGGITLARILEKLQARANYTLKSQNKEQILNTIETYSADRKTSKAQKIAAIRPFYNSGYLVFSNIARNLAQIQSELNSFNPEKMHRKNDTIDCIASALAHPSVLAPARIDLNKAQSPRRATSWRL